MCLTSPRRSTYVDRLLGFCAIEPFNPPLLLLSIGLRQLLARSLSLRFWKLN